MIDVLNVYELRHALLDMNYLKTWVNALELGALWDELVQRANPL